MAEGVAHDLGSLIPSITPPTGRFAPVPISYLMIRLWADYDPLMIWL
jgi:hypothetical protein